MESDEESEDEQILVILPKRESRPYGSTKEEVTKLDPRGQHNEKGYRRLTTLEQHRLQEISMHNRSCPYCEKPIYCAEHMCSCAQTKMLSQDEAFPPTTKKRLEKRQEVPGWKKDPPMFQQGPYHGQNPHPFKEHTVEVWQQFWGAVLYIGKNKLQNP